MVKLIRKAPGRYQTADGRFVVFKGSKGSSIPWSCWDTERERVSHHFTLAAVRQFIGWKRAVTSREVGR